MASTLHDIADRLGLSTSTVSRALTGSPLVNGETRRRVLEIAESLNYKPNAIARAMVMQRTGNIAFLMYKKARPFAAHPFYGSIIDAAMDELARHDYNMFISATNDHRDTFSEDFVRRMIDGAVLVSHYADAVVAAFRRHNVPIVLVNSVLEYDDLSCIVNNNYKGAFEAVEYLVRDRGHKKIALLCGPLEHDSYILRHKAFMDVNLKYDIPVNYRQIRITESGIDEGAQAMSELLASGKLPTAVFAMTDALAIGAMYAIRRAGLRIPDDIAVMGFDDIEFGSLVEPALSTVWVDKESMGRLAVQSLLRRISGVPVDTRIVYAETRLVIRQST